MSLLVARLGAVWRFYRDGFRNMRLGRVLWTIIVVKLCIMFLVLRPWVFPDRLAGLKDDSTKSDHVAGQLLSGQEETHGIR